MDPKMVLAENVRRQGKKGQKKYAIQLRFEKKNHILISHLHLIFFEISPPPNEAALPESPHLHKLRLPIKAKLVSNQIKLSFSG